ncbi:aldolase/citrate lyase family protein [Robiginitalea sp. M366]|uniref:HpcH/HpaI aldolase family protein n=1 Tax=Robiginitalea aestuariiviva TaxID=3036903 RepID=UPI00240D9DDA|nr:aldolase/citrate lyase family protein [Robiginitalea aestuariiviva]MDG1572905.1 aldolase/citrate lyase family protein [Robiginitalea aestuariiviva]
MIKSFRKALHTDEPLHGVLMTLPSPELVEMVSGAGFDWMFLDMEHSLIDFETLQHLIRAVSGSCLVAVRVPEATKTYVSKVLDAGAEAVIFPMVSTPGEARHAVSLCKYPPQGRRGVGLGRAAGYGKDFAPYLEAANDHIACIVQIEDAAGAQNAAEIAAVDGVDALFIGPYDLSMDMGLPGQVSHARIRETIASIACLKAPGTALGIFSTDPEATRAYEAMGFRLLACGIDTALIQNGAQRLLGELRGSSE